MKKSLKIFIPILAVILLSISFFVYIIFHGMNDGRLEKSEIVELLGTDKLPTTTIHGEYAIDTTSYREVVGSADYVFVGYVKDYIDTKYDPENSESIETVYAIDVKDNIKGELTKESTISLSKSGGINKRGTSFVVYENDTLPRIGKYYIFLVYGQPDGGILCTGENSSIEIKRGEDFTNDEKYSQILKAHKNEVVSDRKRFISKYDIKNK